LEDFATEEVLTLEPLPCWEEEEVSVEELQGRVAEMVEHIADEAAASHEANGTRPSDPSVFLRVHPHQRAEKTKRSPRPLVLAATQEVRERFREAYRIFSEACRVAAERLLAGQRRGVPRGQLPSFGAVHPVARTWVAGLARRPHRTTTQPTTLRSSPNENEEGVSGHRDLRQARRQARRLTRSKDPSWEPTVEVDVRWG
jgi:hypothetical protein